MKNFFKHLHLVNKHRFLVFIHCCKCGLFWRGLVHDLSKYSPVEFFDSVKFYYGTHSPIIEARKSIGYSKAWLHHKGRNKHHIEYWCDSELEVQPIMPYQYAVECVCDKLAASKTYLGKNYTPTDLLTYWLKWDIDRSMNPKIREFFTNVFKDIANNGEKYILNKKYMKKMYYEYVLKK